jgi:Ribosomal protein S21
MHTLDGLMKYYERSLNNPSAFKSTPETEAQRELTLVVNDRLIAHDKAHRDASARPNAPGKTLRLKPTLGRTVEITGNFDVTRALRSLEGLCARNRVKQDVQKQRFHVRKGMRKKLLRSSRWRVLFKEGFVAECERVRRMRRQGW